MTIAALRAGQEVDGVFACTRKDRLMSRAGTPYLAVELRERSGAFQGRAFRTPTFSPGAWSARCWTACWATPGSAPSGAWPCTPSGDGPP